MGSKLETLAVKELINNKIKYDNRAVTTLLHRLAEDVP